MSPSVIDPRLFAKLTERERQCLRLVRAQMSSKEIGLALELDAGTVDQHLKSAMRVLGAHRRGLAALALEQHERGSRETLDTQSPDLAHPIPSVTIGPSTDRGGRHGPIGMEHGLREAHAPFLHLFPRRLPWPSPKGEGWRNDLTAWQTIGLSVAVMIAAILLLGVLLTSVSALQTIGWTVFRQPR